ncbi:MAG: phytanoyl-CoA dioxygenase family protein [Pseudomonadota bacterium]|uniref:phytanoyl-CoA dioxygenase family protein n=1 Tax=Phenylobacterium sp. TaxID=1871053 RepID=UPI0025E95418|nr:phytanoyl-CoA dioxygenase family protein [Phenylobacterium sp.]
MNAMIAADAKSDQVVADFIRDGAHLFPEQLDPVAASDLLTKVRATRAFDETLFLSEAEFDADPQYTGVNPRPGRNLLEQFETGLGFVEQAPQVVAAMTTLLGDGYELLNKKLVCGVPAKSIPPWLRARIAGNPVNNLGAYVKPQHRDITYFYGIDFHQDLIDYKEREADFVTLYIYLHPVTRQDAPLFLLKGSHALGGAVFPHDLTRTGPDSWAYRNGGYGETQAGQIILTGAAGFAAMWHACTLHGTQPDEADHERISLRYLLARKPGVSAGIDQVNAALRGPLSLTATRIDLDVAGAAVIKANTVNQA